MEQFTANPELIKRLRRFDRENSISRLASLLTIPDLHANTFRIELLIHLACVFCEGERKPSTRDLDQWLNKNEDICGLAGSEDPIEDVFVSNVMWETGNFRIFEGLWECSDFFLQETLDCLLLGEAPPGATQLKQSILSLLQLSESLLQRCGLPRWKMGGGNPHGHVFLPNESIIRKNSNYLIFSEEDLAHANITYDDLKPFFLEAEYFQQLEQSSLGNSSLERKPLLNFSGRIIVALPTAISVAIRKYVVEWLITHGLLSAFEARLKLKQAEFVFNDLLPHTDSTSFHPSDLPQKPSELKIDEVWQKFDVDKYAHIIVLPGNIEGINRHGFAGISFIDGDTERIFNDYINRTARAFSEKNKGVQGIRIFICGGIGLSRSFAIEEPPEGWTISTFSLPNFTTFVRESETSLLRLWKLCKQKDYFRNNIGEYFQVGDDLNLYAFWKDREFHFVQKETEYPGNCNMVVRSDFVASVRKIVRDRHDFHAVLWEHDHYVRVRRNTAYPKFTELNPEPIYVDPHAARFGEIRGVVVTPGAPWWFILKPGSNSRNLLKSLIPIWESFLSWLGKLPPFLDHYMSELGEKPIKIYLSIEDYASWTDISGIENEEPENVSTKLDLEQSGFDLHIPKRFRKNFMQPDNVGERLILEAITSKFLELAKLQGATINPNEGAEAIVKKIMPTKAMRKFHFFEARSPGAQFSRLGKIPSPRFLQPEDQSWCQLGLASRIDSSLKASISGNRECREFLNAGVEILWKELHSRFSKIDRESLITMALMNNEAILRDRDHWKETSKALISLHYPKTVNQVFQETEAKRASSGLVSRVLVEMAICVSPLRNGTIASMEVFDELSAWIMQLLLLAQWSDAIHYRLTSEQIHIPPNGVLQGDHASFSKVIEDYHSEMSKENWALSAQKYDELYRSRDLKQYASERYPPQFLKAFESEFDLTVDDYIDIVAELWDIATMQNSVVVKVKRKDFLRHLLDNRNIKESKANAFFKSFSLIPRAQWDKVPAGFQNRDYYPWRNQRRLSLGMKPVIQINPGGDGDLLYGLQMCGVNLNYVLGQIEHGWTHPESIVSNQMQSFIGLVADNKGKEFEGKVEQELKNLGWKTGLRIYLSSFGGPSNLGDIDVVAWHENFRGILAIECKRLKPARTISEIGELLSKFKGEAQDRLARHLQRMEWLRNNFHTFQSSLKIPSFCENLEPLLITNRVVPIQFCEELPIETNRIIPLSKLSTLLEALLKGEISLAK